jgi:hypothetical protein
VTAKSFDSELTSDRARPYRVGVAFFVTILAAVLLWSSSAKAAFEHEFLPGLSHGGFSFACGVAVDSEGDTYVSDFSGGISIFDPAGTLITTISSVPTPCGIAVGPAGEVYVNIFSSSVIKLLPSGGEYPPTSATDYAPDSTVNGNGELDPEISNGVAVDQSTGAIYVAATGHVNEYEPDGTLVTDEIATGLGLSSNKFTGVAIDETTGTVYVSSLASNSVFGLAAADLTGPAALTIDKTNTPDGKLSLGSQGEPPAVDQATGDIYIFDPESLVIDQFDRAGRFITRISHPFVDGEPSGVAIAPPGSPTSGDVFFAGASEAAAFGPTVQVPGVALVETLAVTGQEVAAADLHAMVNPEGVEQTACFFEYGETTSYGQTVPCAQAPAQIGEGFGSVEVGARLEGLTSGRLYHVRIVVEGSLGTASGGDVTFSTGPAVVSTRATELGSSSARLEAEINPNGEATVYHFQYVAQSSFESNGYAGAVSAPAQGVAIGSGEVPVAVGNPVSGLQPGSTYHFRVIAANGAATIVGPDKTLHTFEADEAAQSGERVYELVSPSDTDGQSPYMRREGDSLLTNPTTEDGDNLLFQTHGTLPGQGGNGSIDNYEAVRTNSGWTVRAAEPTGEQAVNPVVGGAEARHETTFWEAIGPGYPGQYAGTLSLGVEATHWIRTSDGQFHLIGVGSLGAELNAQGRCISTGGENYVFRTSNSSLEKAKQLEPNAPPDGIVAIYGRSIGGQTHVLSLLPGEVTPDASAEFLGCADDANDVVFSVDDKLYERIGNERTVEVAGVGARYEGGSANGERVFYLLNGNLFAFDSTDGSVTPIGSGGESLVVNVSKDGSHVYFASTQQQGGNLGVQGEENLFVWDDEGIQLVATVSSEDFQEFSGSTFTNLGEWQHVVHEPVGVGGWANDTSRTTSDGSFFVFQSHGVKDYPYDSEGFSEIYRYDANAHNLVCASCRQGKGGASAEAELLTYTGVLAGAPVEGMGEVLNVTEDGSRVLFETREALVLGDTDGFNDVYEWHDGKVSLVSSGHSQSNDYLYAMTGDGRNVFFTTGDRLVSGDLTGESGSIYDARIGGGFPNEAPSAPPCQESNCQGVGGAAPMLAVPSTTAQGGSESGHGARAHKKHHRQRKHRHSRRRHHVRGQGQHRHRSDAATSGRHLRSGKGA